MNEEIQNNSGIISPSTYKPGIVRITQGYPIYHSGRLKGNRHHGIDIVCGVNLSDKVVAIEDSIVEKVLDGDDNTSGLVKLRGRVSDFIIVYKHQGDFEVEEGDYIEAGKILARPNYTNTRSLHLHFEVLDNDGRDTEPLEYFFHMQPYLKYELSEKNFKVGTYYKENHPALFYQLLDRMDIDYRRELEAEMDGT